VCQRNSYQADAAIGEAAIDHHHCGTHEHQGKRAERLGD
jgi:hypothetical protein